MRKKFFFKINIKKVLYFTKNNTIIEKKIYN